MAATVLVRLGLFVRKGIPVQFVPPFAYRIGGSRLVLKALPAALLACSMGLAHAVPWVPDTFAQGGGTNFETMVMVKGAGNQVLVGGLFNHVEGQPDYQGVARYNDDGTLDTAFKVKTDEFVKAIAVQSDGKILIGGQFHYVYPSDTPLTATQIWGIARLNADGTLDSGFINAPAGQVKSNHPVRGIAVQPADGKIVIGGYFTLIDGEPRNRIARLNADGTLDTSFNVGTGANGNIEDVKLQSDGKILISGSFTQVQGIDILGVARLNPDGSLDPTFRPNLDNPGAPNGAWTGNFPVFQMALQSDGKILINGGTLQYAGKNHAGVVRLNPNGTPDNTFKSFINWWGTSVALQPDGKIVLGGDFDVVGQRDPDTNATVGTDVNRQRIARFNSDGTPDTDFDTSSAANKWVWAVLPDGNDRLYIGGQFTSVSGIARRGVARLIPGDPSAASCSRIYLSQGGGGATDLYAGATNLPIALANLGQAGSPKVAYNALGVNPTNRKLYGISAGNQLVTVNAETGNVVGLGTPTGLPVPVGSYNSGAFDNAGNYYVKPSGNNTALYKIDVTATPPTATLITLSTGVLTSDIAWVGSLMYTTDDNGQLYSINVVSGNTTAIGAADSAGGVLGGQFSGTNGLFGSANDGSGLYSINLTTGKRTKISSTPASSANDGASCSDQPLFLGMVPPDQTITFPQPDSPVSMGSGSFVMVPATASSGMPVTYTSLTPAICTVDANTGKVTPVAPGKCEIAADQAGGTNADGVTYNRAPRVTQIVTIQAGAPAPVPTLGAWALGLLAGLLGLMGLRRRKTL